MSQVQVLESPIKSEGDKKEYRLIRLSNGLKALLVKKQMESSVDSEELAAAALTVRVGSFDDPPNAMGLAHFLEHMVHMGSAKYPDEAGYNDYLTANGGRRNALTSCEHSAYFFNVSEKGLPEALDRLQDLTKAPLLGKNSMQREREAVDSEYQMRLSNDAARYQGIIKALIRDSHPASLFDCGNLKTLKGVITDDELHSDLVKFQQRYVASKMFLTVQSTRSLDEMQELVSTGFSSIRSENPGETQRTEPRIEDIFMPEFSSKIIFMKPKAPKKAIVLTWALPSVHKHYKCAPLDYISYLFDNEGEGGLHTYLSENHWTASVGLYMEDNSFIANSQYSLVRLIVELTELGHENIDKVLEAIFSYLLMIKETPIEEHRRLYSDRKEISENTFKYHEESTAINNALNFSSRMLIYENADILRGKKVYQKFDETVVLDCIDRLNRRSFNLLVLSDKHETYNKRDKYYDSEYDELDFPEAYQRLWDARKLNPVFFIERPNPFKTTNFDVFENKEESPVSAKRELSGELS